MSLKDSLIRLAVVLLISLTSADCGGIRKKDIEKVGQLGHLLASQIVLFSSLMTKANITELCSALVVFGSRRFCDCRQCLTAEPNFRIKYCRFGEYVRNSDEAKQLHRNVSNVVPVKKLPEFLADDYFRSYCDFDACPSLPRRCCPPAKTEMIKNSRGCPSCLPVDRRYSSNCLTD